MQRVIRVVGRGILFLSLLVVLVFIASGLLLRAGLAELDGQEILPGLSAPVSIGRDAAGVAKIEGVSRIDVSRALGFLHAQERFFQMDLARRRAAGRMAELFGPRALDWDSRIRAHRLEKLAQRVVRDLDPGDRRELDAYCRGVNAGLAALPGKAFEYLLPGLEAEPWKPEDSVLVILSMYLQLNPWEGQRKQAFEALRMGLPRQFFDFLVSRGTELDAPMLGPAFVTPEIPGPEIFRVSAAETSAEAASKEFRQDGRGIGSNAWAIAGSRSADGRAILACDMHLGLMVPNTWYRVVLRWKEESWGGADLRIVGLSLPGVPQVIVGANSKLAWGFTNSYGDWADLIAVDPIGIASYHSPEGLREFENFEENILIRGQEPVVRKYQSTIWGPVVAEDAHGRPLALRWIAEIPGGVNFGLAKMEVARNIDEAMAAAPGCGIPPQNLVLADSAGRVGWTIAGRIPKRVGCGDSWPPRINSAGCRWDAWVAPEDYPRIVDPPSGVVWTANARVVDGRWLDLLGDGGYNLGARAGQIRDALLHLDAATEEEMLRIQLDDRAIFLSWWRDVLLKTLNEASPDGGRPELRDIVEKWSGHAAIDDPGYRMVRAFRIYARSLVLDPLVSEACKGATLPCGWGYLGQREGPLRKIVSERPAHLLDPRFESYDALLLEAADRVIREFTRGGTSLRDHPWGERNRLRMSHPFSSILPGFLRSFVDMPRQPLPGDTEMPRVQGPSFGASERMVVSPGHEEEGIFEMPGGQSGHPFSPYYREGHSDWVEGRRASLLPGEICHRLRLLPEGGGKLTR